MNQKQQITLSLARKYNFHFDELLEFFKRFNNKVDAKLNSMYNIYQDDVEILYDSKKTPIGFYIISRKVENTSGGSVSKLIVQYFFLVPEVRRMGYFTKFVENLKRQEDIIVLATDQSNMVRACHKLNFKCRGCIPDTRYLSFNYISPRLADRGIQVVIT